MKFIIETDDEYEAKCLLDAVEMKGAIIEALEVVRRKLKYEEHDKKTFLYLETLQSDLNHIFEKYIEDM